ncbi:hypothetical protein [Salinisphaera sp. T31B1]|uniref:hypothetical protein n=1 Tax=Salinisphaera sp. T31B1 TaxID=727963 RepID=UPI003340A549
MRHTIITCGLLAGALAMPVYAATATDGCRAMSGLAGAIMEQRQANADMGDLVARAQTTPLPGITTAIIRDAYSEPLYSSPVYQQRAVRSFSNDVYATCLDAISD